MSGWETLHFTATDDYNKGNYKDSYTNYLKAANALLHKLNNEVFFASRDTVRTKPPNTAHLFTQLKICVQRLENILQDRITNGTLSSPQPSYISDLINTASPTPQHLPLIPFSPLTRHSLHYAHQLATANQKGSIIKQKSSDNNQDDLSTLRNLDEEIRKHKNKLDHVNNQIQSISEVNLLYWDANEVSKQLTIIESELYFKVDFKKDLTLKDKRMSKAQACMDFHRYLTNSFTHQFMIYADTTRSSANSPRGAQHPRDNIIAQAVKIAHLLLNVHRNFNSFAALMKALTSPEVRRIRRLWNNLPTRTNQYLKELSSYIKKEDNDYKAYKEILVQKLESFRDVDKGMVVIPWMQPHYEEIKSINHSYTSGKSGDNTGFILSAPGQRKLASIFSLLEQCRFNVINDEELHTNNFNGTRKANPHKTIDGATINLPPDLSCMGNGNMELHHWLVSRVYLTKQQLIDESMEIEPLGENEQPLCVENEYEEEEEESDHNSVGRYDIGSEDSGDNIEAGTSSNHEITNGSVSQSNKQFPDKLGERNNSKLPLMTEQERNESGSKSIFNGTSSTSVLRFAKSDEPKINIEDDPVGTNSLIKTSNVVNSTNENTFSSFMSSGKTKAIPIPQPAGQKSHQLSISPASMLTNLNPNAEPFIPRYSLSSSAPGPTSDMHNHINVSIKDLTEIGERNKTINNISAATEEEDDDDGMFVYPKSSEDDADDESSFVYPTEATPSNGLKDNAAEEDDKFTYPDGKSSQDPQDDNDDGEGSSFVYPTNENTSSDNNNINISKNGINGVSTKVDKPSSDSITVKLSALSGEA